MAGGCLTKAPATRLIDLKTNECLVFPPKFDPDRYSAGGEILWLPLMNNTPSISPLNYYVFYLDYLHSSCDQLR